MLLNPSASSWYLIHTKPRHEQVALINLERQGYEAYLPMLGIERIRRGRALLVTEPMFPRYLFVRLDSSDQGKTWSPIRSTLGVSALVQFGGRPAKVEGALVDFLREREQSTPPQTRFSPGDPVLITEGPFAGLEAVYQTPDPAQRALILLEILSKPVTLKINPTHLAKVRAASEAAASRTQEWHSKTRSQVVVLNRDSKILRD